MADISETTEEIKKMTVELGVSTESIDLFGQAWDMASNSISSVTSMIETATTTIKLLTSSGIDGFNNLMTIIGDTNGSLTDLSLKAGLVFEPFFGVLPHSIDSFGKFGKAGINAGTEVSESFKRLIPGLKAIPGVTDKMIQGMERFYASADKARNLEMSLIQSAAASGDLNTILSVTGRSFENLSSEASSYIAVIDNVSEATGVSVDVVSNYAQMLAEIPGALRMNIGEGNSAIETTSLLSGAMKVAIGTGQEFEDVQKQLIFSYRELGTTGEGALEFVAHMASAAQDLQIPMDIVRRYTEDTSGAFKLLGDNTEGAIEILAGMSTALEDSGLGPQAISDITGNITQGIAKMDIAQRAFVSQMSGGKGGLSGAFEMKAMLKEGDFSGVFEMVQKAMQNVGGEAVSLEEARLDEGKAIELTKQIEILKSFGLAGSEDVAINILEAFKKGDILKFKEQIEGGKKITGKEEALSNAIDQGNAIQLRQNTLLNKAALELDKLVQLQTMEVAAVMRQTVGSEGMKKYLSNIMNDASKMSAVIGAIGETGSRRTNEKELFTNTKESAKDTLVTAFEGVKALTGKFIEGVSGIKDKLNKVKEAKEVKGKEIKGKEIIIEGKAKPNDFLKTIEPTAKDQKAVVFDKKSDLIATALSEAMLSEAIKIPRPAAPVAPERVMNPKEVVERTVTEKVITKPTGPIEDSLNITIDMVDAQGRIERIANAAVKKEFKRRDQQAFTSGSSE